MRRLSIVLAALAIAISACSQSSSPTVVQPSSSSPNVAAVSGPPRIFGVGSAQLGPIRSGELPGGPAEQNPAGDKLPDGLLTEEERKQRHEATLAEAMEFLAEQKWAEALDAFQIAERLQPNETTRRSIERLKRRVEQESAAEQTAADIQAVLEDGRADEAATLARDALLQFGHTAAAEKLTRLKRQADAIAAQGETDRAARLARFRKEYDDAMHDDNRRAALVALEQALQNGEDAELQKKFDALANDLARHDQLRAQAAELRQDSGRINEAIAALEEAARIWNSPAVRQEIEDCQSALLNRRERLSVAEFDVRGEIGVPDVGSLIADELLPSFRGRYDLVESGQLSRVIDEMNLQRQLGEDDVARREVGQAANLDYLVVGSVTPLAGLTIHARLVNVRTGLVVQTARLVVPTVEELKDQLPRLAQELLMTDDQRRAEQVQREAEAADVEVLRPDGFAGLPPPPEPPLKDVPLPAPIIPARVKAINPADREQFVRRFDQLPPPPPPGQALPFPLLAEARDQEMRQRAFLVALEIGDNQFRRGRFAQAFWQYEFALNLFPGHLGVRMRIARCRPLLPVVMPAPPTIDQRVAALDFAIAGNPNGVTPWLAGWLPERLAAYFAPEFHVIDRAEVFWWMARLGLTPDMVLTDPVARIYLGRALNVRYFLFGTAVQGSRLQLTTYLIDSEYGYLASSARVFIRTMDELPLRISELAWLTKLTPDQRRVIENESAQWALLVNDARAARRDRNWERVGDLCSTGLRLRPRNVELQVYLGEAQQRIRELNLQVERERERVAYETRQRHQLELARRAEAARLKAALLADAERQRHEAQRRAAAQEMMQRAQIMVRTNRFSVAIQLIESACALRPDDESLYRELARVRARSEETARANAAEAAARREAELRRRREAELARTRAELEAERQRRAQEEKARRQWVEDRDQREYDRLLGLARQFSAKQQYDQAVAAAQKAKRLRPTPEANALVSQLLLEVARVEAQKRGAAEKAELERQLAVERQARQAAEAEAAKSRELYESLLSRGRQLIKAEQFEEAEVQLEQARKISQTDAVLAALSSARTGKKKLQARLDAEREKQEALKRQNDRLKTKLAEAQSALTANKLDLAVSLFRDVKKIDPTNVDVLAGLARAEQLQEREQSRVRRETEQRTRLETVKRLLASGKASLAAGKFDAAVLSLGQAAKLDPRNVEVKAALAQAQQRAGADAASREKLKKLTEEYERHMNDGRRFFALKQYERALASFRFARDLNREDKAAEEFIEEVSAAIAAQSKNRDAAAQRGNELARHLSRFRAALTAGKLDLARQAYTEAAKIDAKHREVVQALADLRKAQDASESAMKTGRQRDEQFALLLNRARSALSQKRLDEASEAVAEALRLKPGDASARLLQTQISRQRNDGAGMPPQDRVNQLVTQARAALAAKKYDDADKLLSQADALVPRDPSVAAVRAELKKLRDAMAADEAEARRKQQTYDTAMKNARQLLQAGKHDEAARAVTTALQAMPRDNNALTLQRQIDEARKTASTTMLAEQKRKQFGQHIADARTALKAGKLEDATREWNAASRLFPQERDAIALKKEIDDARQNAAMAARKRQEYDRAMTQGRTAMRANRHADAIKAFETALTAIPGDSAATQALAEAKKAANNPMPMPMGKPPAYTQQMQQGANHERGNRYDLALAAYRVALQAVANDPDAQKKVEFCQLMVRGDLAIKQRKFVDARVAYTAALRLFPADTNARAGLRRAMMGN